MTVLPRELCFLPIQVLLVSNNRLTSLPEELGRMEQLTELDAACNQITHLPARMSDLKSLRSLSLRSNHLVYLPRGNFDHPTATLNHNLLIFRLVSDIDSLNLESLDVSCNRIATLPVELRLMKNLVNLVLDSNPLTSPPASVSSPIHSLLERPKYSFLSSSNSYAFAAWCTFSSFSTQSR